ncbi:hypothetical protein GP486_008649 [Trichoglossum hirsutum]|uniref:Phage minor tail protein L n=1 Tax=Trichoglossum hirsutum TaxID=265104 RepID=A0A9P8I2X6_9PEZI|nr:hypothetical protein GP486_008649 [Trichoglossum hirsutum]
MSRIGSFHTAAELQHFTTRHRRMMLSASGACQTTRRLIQPVISQGLSLRSRKYSIMTDPNIPLETHIQGSSLTAPIELIELDATDLGGPIFRFAPMPILDYVEGKVNMTPIVWNGQEWPPFPFETADWAWDGQGAMPQPTVTVANVSGYFTAANIEFNDLLGVKLTRYRTFAKFLDGMPDADPEAMFPPEIYRVDTKVKQDNTTVQWSLSTDIDHNAALLPGRIILKNICTRIYRTFDPVANAFDYTKATCPYTGSPNFDALGNPTDAPHDICSKQLVTGCKKRFVNTPLPTYQFPGAGAQQQS